ncbi:MAG: N(4)-(beta-N-acetylglucosaminyl)-L-asparaginase [Chloroflexota bacterium]|nr:N(4)-(beta-N-acetylglucosaminyl)-L-asparaginase [Chloroflexota bacterium]MDE2947798.1 N(4)-(beta-N-acetylglucosaminyl)-L-asparaginase [Chloroflexota bacterium]
MLIIASSNGAIGIDRALQTLKAGGSALDAVEIGIRAVEANPAEHSVGYNGYPNIMGELELDASIMDGSALNSGAVALLRGFPYAISVARQVMERKLPHVLLAGAGAERFAREVGAEAWDEMLTEEIRAVWRERLAAVGATQSAARRSDDIPELTDESPMLDLVKLATDPERVAGTVNFIAIDSAGDIASGVSTSGWAWKYPGRIGDSPIIGAGNYADNRYGACCCTGMGEMAIRAGTARSLVLYLKMGMPLAEAARQAMLDLRDLGGDYIGGMNLIALDSAGEHVGLTSRAGGSYIVQHVDMETHQMLEREVVAIPARWGGNDGPGMLESTAFKNLKGRPSSG